MAKGPAQALATGRTRWWAWYLGGLFIVAMLWRGAALMRLAGGPLVDLLNADSSVYWEWASEIRAGGLIGTQPLFFSALYPCVLAAARTMLGDDIMPVLWTQVVLGASTVVLVTDACRRLATPVVAACVGVGLAGYGMAVFFDLMVLSESLLLFLGSLAIWLLARDGRGAPALVGGLVGVMALGRPTFLLLLVPYVAHLWAAGRPARLATTAAVLCLPALATLVTGLHHVRTTGEWVPFTYSSGYNFNMGNGPHANGTYVPFTHSYDRDPDGVASGGTAWDGRDYILATQGLQLSPIESSRYWWDQGVHHLQRQPLRAAQLVARKVGLMFNRRELPQIVDARVYGRACGPLGWPGGLGFIALAGCAALGVPVVWRRGGIYRLMLGWMLALVVGGALFFVVDRYRIHLLPVMAVLSAVGVANLLRHVRERDWRRVAWLGGVGGLGCAIACLPAIGGEGRNVDWLYATTMGEAWLARGDARSGVEWLEKAVTIDERGELPGSNSSTGLQSRAAVYENLGTAHLRNGDDRRALEALAMAVHLAPEARTTRARYADALAAVGNAREAQRQYRLAALAPEAAAARLLEAAAECQGRGEDARAMRYLESALAMQPGYEAALVPLVRLQIMTGDLEGARVRLREAANLGLDINVRRVHEAWIHAMEGDTSSARRILAMVPTSVLVGDPRVAGTMALIRETVGIRAPR